MKTKKAKDILLILKSIEHWEDVRDNGTFPDSSNCPLCSEYLDSNNRYKGTEETACGKCPIAIETKYSYCIETPYNDYILRHNIAKQESKAKDGHEENRKYAADNMIDFLVNLLPAKIRDQYINS